MPLMAQIVVRDLEEDVKQRLKQRAALHGRSMEAEIREILRNAAIESGRPIRLGTAIVSRFAGTGLDTELPELRGQIAQPMELKP
jgi:antitoxin FitA